MSRRQGKRARSGKRRRTRRKAAPRSKKALVRLIKSVALKDAETKAFRQGHNLISDLDPLSNTSYGWCIPVYQDVPKAGNTLTADDRNVIGNELIARGVMFKFSHYTGFTSLGAASPVTVRISLVSTDRPSEVTGVPLGTTGPIPGVWLDADSATGWTSYLWNAQKIRILKTKKYQWTPQGGLSTVRNFRFWCNIKGKKTCREDESLVLNNVVGDFKGRTYFLLFEMNNNGTTTIKAANSVVYDKVAYFKDP